jgi:two-component system CheB/CheR fusion protein
VNTVSALLRASTGRDLSGYKRSTILRRMQRRMQLQHMEELSDYVALLHKQPEEVRALGDDMLVTVTSFFRDPDVFTVLERDIVPRLLQERTFEDPLRAWSIGCATGEEAYSIAMLLLEQATQHEPPPQVQVFATDLHARSLTMARQGVYSGDIETEVSAKRLTRFFHRDNAGYRVRDQVRELVIFAAHNVLSDPPFSRVDLVFCRNLLIYLERSTQRQVIQA